MTQPDTPNGPILIDLDGEDAARPDMVDPVPDAGTQDSVVVSRSSGRRPWPVLRWFLTIAVALVGFAVSVATWDFTTGMIARNTYLGYGVAAVVGICVVLMLWLVLREWRGYMRLARLDALRADVDAALVSGTVGDAENATHRVALLYRGRDDVAWGLARYDERAGDAVDAEGLIALAETELVAPLDVQALREVETAARQVATVTAIVPMALADVFVALFANVRMIRAIAEVYGGRSGTLGSWRLLRGVTAHLVATGAVAVSDELIGTIAGGGVLTKVSRRFGEGVINGALTARVGIAAMDVCRPMPYVQVEKPGVAHVIKRAMTGVFT